VTKTIVVSDSVFDWLARRTDPKKSVAQVLQEIRTLVDRVETDLAKYHKWVDGSNRISPPNPPTPNGDGG